MGVLPLHGAALLGLLDLQLGEEAHEPFEGSLLTVDPVEVNLKHKKEFTRKISFRIVCEIKFSQTRELCLFNRRKFLRQIAQNYLLEKENIDC